MTRKEILVFFLREIRSEFRKALDGLSPDDLAALMLPGRKRTIGWMVCHCMRAMDHFIHKAQTGRSWAEDHPEHRAFFDYAGAETLADVKPPDFSLLASAWDEHLSACIRLIEAVPDRSFDNTAPYWQGKGPESIASNCVRMINHKNAHLRAIWMIRGAAGETERYPHQSLSRKPDDPRGVFYVPDA